MHGARGSDALKDSVNIASRYVSIVAVPMAFALAAVSRPALTLLVGVEYAGGAIPLTILALASVSTIIATALTPILIILNETLLAALTSLLPLPLSVGVALIAIPVLGIVGASVARALSMILSLLLAWYFVRGKILIKLDYQAIMKSTLAGGVMALAMEAAQLLYYSRFLLPLYLSVGLLVYLLVMRALRAVNAADVDLIRRMLGSRFSRICDLLSWFVLQ